MPGSQEFVLHDAVLHAGLFRDAIQIERGLQIVGGRFLAVNVFSRPDGLKESFQLFWSYKQPWRAKQHLLKWMNSAMRSKLESFKKSVGMLQSHLDGVLAWTKTRLSNGAVEGMNNKIKSISHRSFGFRRAANFIAAIYHCCAGLPRACRKLITFFG
jgi:hypothetical protein